MSNKNKFREGIVYSTNSSFQFEAKKFTDSETLPPQQQTLRIRFETKHRGGKMATVISNFIGKENDLDELGKYLKVKCGTGGAVKDGEIIVQGDFRERIKTLLLEKNYKVKGV